MKAIRVSAFGPPDVLRVETVPDPTPGPNQVVVRVHAAGVNPVDTYIRSGAYARKPALPFTPGSDGAGEIVSVGDGVSNIGPGDRVYVYGSITGMYAEQALCDVSSVFRLPGNVSFEQGAAVGVPYATAYYGLFQRGDAKPGETLLVHGASGGVGTAAVQIAAAHGLTVIGTAGTPEGRQRVLDEGAHQALDHSDPTYLDGVQADLVLEMLANVNLAKDLTILRPKGRVVVIGSRGKIEIDPRDTMSRDAAILGLILNNATPDELRSIHAAIGAGLANGTLRPVVGKRFALADAPAAHEAVMRSGAHGKIVLLPAS